MKKLISGLIILSAVFLLNSSAWAGIKDVLRKKNPLTSGFAKFLENNTDVEKGLLEKLWEEPPPKDPFATRIPEKAPVVIKPIQPAAAPRPQPSTQNPQPSTIDVIALPDLRINGIVWNTRRPQAIINDQIVEIGDTIENTKIVDIKKEGVQVSFGGRKFIITTEK